MVRLFICLILKLLKFPRIWFFIPFLCFYYFVIGASGSFYAIQLLPFASGHCRILRGLTCSSIVTGNILDSGSTVLGVNKAGWSLHSAIHSTRSDINCVAHVHLPDVVAVGFSLWIYSFFVRSLLLRLRICIFFCRFLVSSQVCCQLARRRWSCCHMCGTTTTRG